MKRLAMCCAAAVFAAVGFGEEGYTDLFDGKTLKGWTVRGGENKFYVEDGLIRGEAVPGTVGINTFLITDRTYDDFDFKVEFKLEGGNSGVQFRSKDRSYDPALDWCDYPGRRKVFGYQAEITPNGDNVGRIYDEERRGYQHGIVWLDVATPKERQDAAKAAFRKGDWNEMRVRCEGPHIQTWVNGVLVADILDETDKSGYIGLQMHVQYAPKKEGEKFVPGKSWWRNPRIKELNFKTSFAEKRFELDRGISQKCQNAGGTNEVMMIEFEGRTVLRLNGFEVYDSGAKK